VSFADLYAARTLLLRIVWVHRPSIRDTRR